MHQIQKILSQEASRQELTNCSNVPDKAMLPEEQAMIKAKYASSCFSKIPASEIMMVGQALLLKLHVVTGWTIPQKELMDILIDQFCLKLQESYGNVNADEMLFAFRNNPGVKDWGKAMNLNLIDEVMTPYLERRVELSRLEERVRPLQALGAPQISDEEFILSVKRLYRMDGNWRKIPLLAYKVLAPPISEERKEEIKEKVRAAIGEGEDFKDRCRQYAVKLYFDELE